MTGWEYSARRMSQKAFSIRIRDSLIWNRKDEMQTMRKIKKYLGVLKVLIALRFHNLMVFCMDFLAPFFIDGSLFLVQLLVFQAVYANVDTVGGWGSGEMILYIGTFSLLNAVSMLVCFFGIVTIPEKIRSGEMDLYLSKPVSPLFRLTFEKVNPGSGLLVIMSILIIVYGAGKVEGSFTLKSVLAYLFWVTVMQILYYEMDVIIRSVSFYVVSAARISQLEEAGLDLCMKLPGISFYGVYKVIFYCILPYGIMATLPVQSLIGEMNRSLAAMGIGVVGAFTLLTYLLWTRGIRHYNSVQGA